MNKRFLRVICLVLSLTLLLGAAGCGGTEDVWSEWIETVEVPDETSSDVGATDNGSTDTSSTDSTTEKPSKTEGTSSDNSGNKVTSSNKKPASSKDTTASDKKESSNSSTTVIGDSINITANGKSKYKIVVSLSNDGYDEGRLMQKVIKATSNASVPLILDTETSKGPEIIIGETTREASEKLMKKIGNNEYLIETEKNGNIVIVGATAYALKLGVEYFLTTYLGYDKNATQMGTGKEKSVPIALSVKKNILDDYKLVWSDEFEGSTLDTDKWTLFPHMREQTHLKVRDDETAVKVENGSVNLISGRIDDVNYWTNASLTTSHTMVFKYGYVEMRAKVPFGRPAFPSFWMKSSSYEANEPLVTAEIDIFEHFCHTGDDYLQTGIHKWYLDGTGDHYVGPQIGRFNFGSIDLAEQWHTYSMLWTEESLNFMVDGKTYHTIDITKTGDFGSRKDGMGAFHDYFFLIFNNYLHTSDGSEEGNKDEQNAKPSDEFPINYEIDYVRLYQLPGQGDIANVKGIIG